MYTPRFLTSRLESLVRNFPVVVVSGARQVGKTTLLKHVFGAKADLVVFDPAQDIGNARMDPDLFLDNHPTPVILDEIQHVPELVAALTAQEINASQLGRELGISPQTGRRWLELLVATFQWFELPAYSGNAVKRVSAKAKGFLADTGLACWAQAIATPAALGGHPLWGRLFESFVASELRKQMALMSPPPRLHHWRSAGGAEVDLLLERDGRFFPIEIKGKTSVSGADARGIKAFREAYPNLNIAPGLIIALCERVERVSTEAFSLPWDLGAPR